MSSYPGALDTLTNPAGSDPMNGTHLHSAQHADANDAIEKIQLTLGLNPHGGSADVAERLDDIEASIAGGGGGSGNIGPDTTPSSPSAYDDEFDSLSGWSTLGTLDVSNVTDAPGWWRGQRAMGTSTEINGIYKTAPSTPFTVTAKLPGANASGANGAYGLMLLDSTATALWTIIWIYGSGYGAWNDFYHRKWTNRTTPNGAGTDYNAAVQSYPRILPYTRLVVNSSTNVDVQFSPDGVFWTTAHSAVNPGITVAKAGICVASNGTARTVDVLCDWIRFT